MERPRSLDTVSIYLRTRSSRVTAEQSFYGSEGSALRAVRSAKAEIGAPGRNPVAIEHRIALAKLYLELEQGVPSAWRALNAMFGYRAPLSEAVAYRIIRNARQSVSDRELEEWQWGMLAVAAVVERSDGFGAILNYRELEGRLHYGKLIGDLTIPMGERKGSKDDQALRRMVRRELFDGNKLEKDRWREIFEFPFGEEPIGVFGVVDCRVNLYVLRLKVDEAELGGFSSKKVEGHTWVDPHYLLANKYSELRDGAPEMTAYYLEFGKNPLGFDRGIVRPTALNHAIAAIPKRNINVASETSVW